MRAMVAESSSLAIVTSAPLAASAAIMSGYGAAAGSKTMAFADASGPPASACASFMLARSAENVRAPSPAGSSWNASALSMAVRIWPLAPRSRSARTAATLAGETIRLSSTFGFSLIKAMSCRPRRDWTLLR